MGATRLIAPLLAPGVGAVVHNLIEEAVGAASKDAAVASGGHRAHGDAIAGARIQRQRLQCQLPHRVSVHPRTRAHPQQDELRARTGSL